MRNRSRPFANLACLLALAGSAAAAPAVAPLAAPEAAQAAPIVPAPAKMKRAPKRAAVHNADALELGASAEVVGNYELGASVGGSDVPGTSEMDREIEGIVKKITKPPAPKKGLASPPSKVPETALPRKSREPAPAQKKTEPASMPPAAIAPARAAPAVPSGETGSVTDRALVARTSALSPSLSRIELAALAAMMFPRPKWRASSEATDASAYFRMPRGH